jgi:hypothetical protein
MSLRYRLRGWRDWVTTRVAQDAPEIKRYGLVSLASAGVVEAGQSAWVEAAPLVNFRPDEFIIRDAGSWEILEIRVARHSLMLGSPPHPFPGSLFSALRADMKPVITWPTVQVGQAIRLMVLNITPQRLRFLATLRGPYLY